MDKLTISILVHEDFTYIANALHKLQTHTTIPYTIYVVINKGTQENIQTLRASFPDLQFIINEIPQGFAANHNMIMRRAETPYIALLNDDIDFGKNVLDSLVEHLERHADVGVVAPQLQYEDGTPQVTAYSDPSLFRMIYKISGLGSITHQKSPLRKWIMRSGMTRVLNVSSLSSYSNISDVQVLKAAFIVVRKAMVDDIGYIDETTKAYGEEVDWNWRMRQNEWRVVLMPDARVTHFGVGQALSQLSGWQITEDRKAILNYFIKHRPQWQTFTIRLSIILFHAIQAVFAVFISPKNIKAHLDTIQVGLLWKRNTR